MERRAMRSSKGTDRKLRGTRTDPSRLCSKIGRTHPTEAPAAAIARCRGILGEPWLPGSPTGANP